MITKPLYRDPAITCQWDALDPDPDPEDENDLVQCNELSSFVVERNDGDQSFGWDGKHEACEYHLAEVVASMADGDAQVQAVITIRWWTDRTEAGQ